ncbi:MAG: hypothetical protein IKZ13_07600 [Akkermansia sp.]|nr:hypothetical protein [Akkermansia sp.]
MKRTFFLILLCLGLAVCGESPALDVAAKHLEDYRQQCKACGNEDALQELRLQCEYLVSKDAVQAAPLDFESWMSNMPFILALHEKAYRLAETRYKKGLGTLWDMYETGMQLYSYTESCASICCTLSRPAPESLISPEQLKELRQTLSQVAMAGENRERWLKAEILWSSGIEQDLRKVRAYRTELVELQQKRYRQGVATLWDVALAELELQQSGLFLPPAEEVLQRWEEYIKAISRVYEQMSQAAEAHPSYSFSKMMCELRLLQITTERTFCVLKAVPSIIQDEVARAEGLSAPSNVSRDSD